MQLSKVSCVLALCSTILAGQCYNHVEGGHKVNCVNRDQLAKFADDYCENHWDELGGDWIDFHDSNKNTAKIGKIGRFSDKAACTVAFSKILHSCYRSWDGGHLMINGALLNMDFCEFSNEAERVEHEGSRVSSEGGRVRYEGLRIQNAAKGVRYGRLSSPSNAQRVRYEGLPPPADARRVRYEGLPPPADARRVRYEGLPPPADARRVRYEGLPPPADARRVRYAGLRIMDKEM
ncbi:hypothetical protein ACMFMG_007205 [Clarireedia jacksonii]